MKRVGACVWLGVVALLAGGVARAEPDGTFHASPGRGVHPLDGEKVASYATPPGDAAAPAATPSPPPPAPESATADGPFDPFRLGAFTGVGFPRPISIEGFIKIDKVMGLGLEYSLLPSMTVGGVDLQMNAIMGDLRVFPLEDGFFIGVGVGRQHLSAISSMPLPAQLGGGTPGITIDTYVLNPRIGFLSTWSWGLTVGIDAGIQIPLAATTQNTIPSGIPISPDPTGTANLFGKSVLPTVDLLRIGLLL